MKKLTLSFLASVSFCAPALATAPVYALPIWAEMVAGAHCRYLGKGFTWDDSLTRALRDNKHWLPEIQAAGRYGTRSIALALSIECGELNEKAFLEKERMDRITGTI